MNECVDTGTSDAAPTLNGRFGDGEAVVEEERRRRSCVACCRVEHAPRVAERAAAEEKGDRIDRSMFDDGLSRACMQPVLCFGL
jgi:hypothetical protein